MWKEDAEVEEEPQEQLRDFGLHSAGSGGSLKDKSWSMLLYRISVWQQGGG